MRKLTTKEFIDRARAVHDCKYGYAFSMYDSFDKKININCTEHGMFEMTPNNHLKGRGCPTCGGSIRHTNHSFIEKAKKVHGENNYTYSFVEYVNAMTKVKIICPTHGVFSIRPANHLYGQGCPGCANYGFDRTKKGFLYILRSECGQYMKIGITNKPDQRHAQLVRNTPFKFKRIELIEGQGDQIANLEKELLANYQPANFTETFDGSTEWRLWDGSIPWTIPTVVPVDSVAP